MLITKQFCWTHLGKTGGDSTRMMFEVLNLDDIILEHDIRDPRKHETFSKHRSICQDKKKILNIRRLPTWLVSDWNHQLLNPENNKVNEVYQDGLVEGLFAPKGKQLLSFLADRALKSYFCQELGGIDFWFRTEYLAHDFIKVMRNFVEISEKKETEVKNTFYNKTRDRIRSQKSSQKINSNQEFFALSLLTLQEIKSIYDRNPFWSSIERNLYGNLLYEDEEEMAQIIKSEKS